MERGNESLRVDRPFYFIAVRVRRRRWAIEGRGARVVNRASRTAPQAAIAIGAGIAAVGFRDYRQPGMSHIDSHSIQRRRVSLVVPQEKLIGGRQADGGLGRIQRA